MPFKDFTDEEEEMWTKQLEILLIAAFNFSCVVNKYQKELKNIVIEIEKEKDSVSQPKNGFHYLDCVWAKSDPICGPDTCACNFRFWNPKHFILRIIELIGLDYILHHHSQNLEQ